MTDRYKLKENYLVRDPEPNKWQSHPNSNILDLYSNFIKGNVLDFGCNHGACSFLICKNKNVTGVVGLDLNEEAIKIGEQTKSDFPECNIKFICENILDVNFNEMFDTIVSFHTLEHIYPEDVNYVLSKLGNSLVKNGHLIISIPYRQSHDNGNQHVAYYDEISLSQLFESNGFTTVECLQDNRLTEGGILTGIFKKEK